jgi:hypothetical protein
MGPRDKKFVVQVNRLKYAHGADIRENVPQQKWKARKRANAPAVSSDDEEAETNMSALPLAHDGRPRDDVLPDIGNPEPYSPLRLIRRTLLCYAMTLTIGRMTHLELVEKCRTVGLNQ